MAELIAKVAGSIVMRHRTSHPRWTAIRNVSTTKATRAAASMHAATTVLAAASALCKGWDRTRQRK
jgi:hypothetical protein